MSRPAPLPRLSTLRCSPRKLLLSDFPHDYSFAIVDIDGQTLSDHAQPFSADDGCVELLGCTGCGTPGCGYGFISVRRHAGVVVWVNPLEQPVGHGTPGLPIGAVYWFGQNQYREACGSGDVDQLPRLSDLEFRAILDPPLPPICQALYIDGLDPAPERTAAFLRDFAAAIGEKPIDLSESGPDFAHLREIGIGLDVQGNPESRFWLARSGDSWRIRCIAHPCIPVWISSSALTELLAPFTPTHRLPAE